MSVYAPNVTVVLKAETCCNCGCHFAMDDQMYQARKRDGNTFYCPNGHGQHYTETEEQRLKAKLEAAERQRRFAEWEAESNKRQLTATKGQFTKYRNRVAKGVCPCCNRTFVNVLRHMASQHPDEPVSKAARAEAEAKRNEPPQKNIIHTWGNRNRLKLQKCKQCGLMRGNIEKHWIDAHQGK